MSTKLELFIKNKHEELKRVMSDTRISSFLEKHELDEIYDDRFLEILLCMYFQHKGEKVLLRTKIDKLEKEIKELKKKSKK